MTNLFEKLYSADFARPEEISKYQHPRGIVVRTEMWGEHSPWTIARGARSSTKSNIVEEQSLTDEKIESLTKTISSLQEELVLCRERINNLYNEFEGKPNIKTSFIYDVGEGFEVICPIPIIIEESDDETMITFPDAGVSGFGSTEAEALLNFKKSIIDLYNDLRSTPENELGEIPSGWLRTLNKVIKPIEQTN